MYYIGLASLGCKMHTRQLIVYEGLLSQHSVSDALTEKLWSTSSTSNLLIQAWRTFKWYYICC